MSLNKNLTREFSPLLLQWNREKNDRKMPWKGEKDPYKIWLSEIILQQTRVEQGLRYYKKFVEKFSTIQELAAASDTKIYKLWEGLGYYSRCKNLIETARFISKNLKGLFPDNYENIKALKGVGSYTASAIASFAYNLPYAVIDGNVFRVLSRIFGVKKAIDSTEGKKYFTKLASELLDKMQAGIYNQALMDFGAVVCKPVNPQCTECVFRKYCYAYKNEAITKLPFKEKKIKVKNRWFYYIIMEYRSRVYIKQRTSNDIWKNLYEFVLIEPEKKTTMNRILELAIEKGIFSKKDHSVQSISFIQSQLLSHQKISGQFIKLKLRKAPYFPGSIAIFPSQLTRYAFPQFINTYFKQ
jgi:A/G-specific adenine glycosylase